MLKAILVICPHRLPVVLLLLSLFIPPLQTTNLISIRYMTSQDKSVEGSLTNLKYNEEIENSTYGGSLIKISDIWKFITIYELITVLLIIGAGLCGISEIAKNKVLGYPGVIISSIGAIILLLTIFVPSILVG